MKSIVREYADANGEENYDAGADKAVNLFQARSVGENNDLPYKRRFQGV